MDKRITRWANMGYTSVIMFGKKWPLSPGTWGVDQARKTVEKISYDPPTPLKSKRKN